MSFHQRKYTDVSLYMLILWGLSLMLLSAHVWNKLQGLIIQEEKWLDVGIWIEYFKGGSGNKPILKQTSKQTKQKIEPTLSKMIMETKFC